MHAMKRKLLEQVGKWFRYQVRKLTRPRVVNNNGLRLYLGEHATTSYARSIYRDSHEAEEREVVARNLDETDTVLECGAGLGMVTILCCWKVGSERVHSFEANPSLEPLLRKNFELNNVAPNLQIKLVGLETGEGEFFVDQKFVVSSRFEQHGTTTRTSQTIPAVSLQSLIDSIQPSFLIMDIEGAEVDLADERLDLSSLKKLCIEMHPHIVGHAAVSRVIGRLIAQGFNLNLRECQQDVLYFSRAA
jgi:FkbM family methyltransferase